MLHSHNSILSTLKRWVRVGAFVLVLFAFSVSLSVAWPDSASAARESRLPQGNPIKDGRSLLQYALPIDNSAIRRVQLELEEIDAPLRGRRWGTIKNQLSTASRVLGLRRTDILEAIPEERQPDAEALLSAIETEIEALQSATEAEDKEQISSIQSAALDHVGELEALMVQGFPFEVPEEYSNLPQLKGRATIEMTTEQGSVRMLLDGYSAPVTAGNFVDLVQRGFYNGLQFTRAEESYVLQAGDPPGSEEGFIDPKTKQYRAIPLEILVRSDSEPIYGFTLEEIGRYREQPVLPFSVYGTVAMARPEADANGASSQFFFFLFQPELTPAGLNLLDGRYAVFGYVTQGKDVLGQLKQGDTIKSMKVVSGAENLVKPR